MEEGDAHLHRQHAHKGGSGGSGGDSAASGTAHGLRHAVKALQQASANGKTTLRPQEDGPSSKKCKASGPLDERDGHIADHPARPGSVISSGERSDASNESSPRKIELLQSDTQQEHQDTLTLAVRALGKDDRVPALGDIDDATAAVVSRAPPVSDLPPADSAADLRSAVLTLMENNGTFRPTTSQHDLLTRVLAMVSGCVRDGMSQGALVTGVGGCGGTALLRVLELLLNVVLDRNTVCVYVSAAQQHNPYAALRQAVHQRTRMAMLLAEETPRCVLAWLRAHGVRVVALVDDFESVFQYDSGQAWLRLVSALRASSAHPSVVVLCGNAECVAGLCYGTAARTALFPCYTDKSPALERAGFPCERLLPEVTRHGLRQLSEAMGLLSVAEFIPGADAAKHNDDDDADDDDDAESGGGCDSARNDTTHDHGAHGARQHHDSDGNGCEHEDGEAAALAFIFLRTGGIVRAMLTLKRHLELFFDDTASALRQNSMRMSTDTLAQLQLGLKMPDPVQRSRLLRRALAEIRGSGMPVRTPTFEPGPSPMLVCVDDHKQRHGKLLMEVAERFVARHMADGDVDALRRDPWRLLAPVDAAGLQDALDADVLHSAAEAGLVVFCEQRGTVAFAQPHVGLAAVEWHVCVSLPWLTAEVRAGLRNPTGVYAAFFERAVRHSIAGSSLARNHVADDDAVFALKTGPDGQKRFYLGGEPLTSQLVGDRKVVVREEAQEGRNRCHAVWFKVDVHGTVIMYRCHMWTREGRVLPADLHQMASRLVRVGEPGDDERRIDEATRARLKRQLHQPVSICNVLLTMGDVPDLKEAEIEIYGKTGRMNFELWDRAMCVCFLWGEELREWAHLHGLHQYCCLP